MPSALETVVAGTPVAVLVAITVTPETTAPEGSATAPVIDPRLACAEAPCVSSRKASAHSTARPNDDARFIKSFVSCLLVISLPPKNFSLKVDSVAGSSLIPRRLFIAVAWRCRVPDRVLHRAGLGAPFAQPHFGKPQNSWREVDPIAVGMRAGYFLIGGVEKGEGI